MKPKKAISNILVISIFLAMILTILLATWVLTKNIILKAPAELSCISYMNPLKIEKACYLDSNEVKLIIKRNLEDFELKKIKVLFSPYGAIWEISGKKCSDIKLNDKEYGNYCEIVQPGNTISYIFNMAHLDKQNKVSLYLNIGNSVCVSDSRVISSGC
jgi:hypothetical protein